MVLNHECVRSLLLCIEKEQTLDSHGKPNVLKLRKLHSVLSDFERSDINLAASYLVEKNLIALASGQSVGSVSPHAYVISRITAAGYDYLAAVRSDTVWKKIKDKLGSVGLASVPAVIEVASQYLAGRL